ncbi:myo-inositol transporter [Fusarium coicis]|nr:myo-inositol transporter [Fusarium coicis]
MCVGRVLVGLGVGSASMIIPLYIAEIAPAKYRGRMISIDMVFLATGSLLSYAFDAAFYKVPHGWRYLVGLGELPSILLGVLLFWCPESLRQLCFHNRSDECLRVLQRMYPTANETQLAQMMTDMQYGVTQAKALNEEISVRQFLKSLVTVPANRRAAIVACGLMVTQQLYGFNTMMYYSSTPSQIVGFDNLIAVGTIVTATNWIFTFASIFLIYRVGRSRLLLWTMLGMPVFLLLAAGVFAKIPIDRQTLELTDDKVGWPAIVVLVSMILFVASYAAGLGCVPWQANEFFPMEVRAMGTMTVIIKKCPAQREEILIRNSSEILNSQVIARLDVLILPDAVGAGLAGVHADCLGTSTRREVQAAASNCATETAADLGALTVVAVVDSNVGVGREDCQGRKEASET